jgi:hypothetical protein
MASGFDLAALAGHDSVEDGIAHEESLAGGRCNRLTE